MVADKIEEAFGLTTQVLFGKPLLPLAKYEVWLKSRVPSGASVKSALGSGNVYLPDYGFFKNIPADRAVSFRASEVASKKAAGEIGDDLSFASIASEMGEFAYFVPAFVEGKNVNVENTAVYLSCIDVRDSFDPFTTKKAANVFSVMDSEYLFGVYRTTKSAFLVHCYNCVSLSRCFEMDSAINCADSMFCHNVENLENCLFCFNTKSKKYAVGNLEVGRERYLEIRKMILDYFLAPLETLGRLDFDIYNVLAIKKAGKEK